MSRNIYAKPYPTIGEILDEVGYDYDYVSYRIMMKDGKNLSLQDVSKQKIRKLFL